MKNFLQKKRNNKILTEEESIKIANDLRKLSRMSYLQKRSQQQLDLFKRQIDDEQKLFGGLNLSKEEIKRNEINKKIFQIANESIKNNFNQNRFEFEEKDEKNNNNNDKNIKKLYDRYNKKNNTNNNLEENDDDLWENEQKKKTGIKFGAQNIKNDNYNLLIENPINFIKKELLKEIKNKNNNLENIEEKILEKNILSTNINYTQTQTEKNTDDFLQKIKNQRESLPIFTFKSQILELLSNNQIIFIQGETGSGKTTQIPQYLNENNFTQNNKKIAITQPRRVACLSVASRVAYEMNCKLGHEVGYSIRFEENLSKHTKIKFMTEGILLQEFLSDPLLSNYSVIIIDEAHERTIYTDILLSLLKNIILSNKNLKLIISSATLTNKSLIDFFSDFNPPFLTIPGRRFPVDIYYTKEPEADYIEASVITALQIHITQPLPGDILIFLTGEEEITLAKEMLYNRTKGLQDKIPNYIVLQLYSNLPSEEQIKIFMNYPNQRKIILSTNIAETSLTIDGIVYVIDCGFSKQICFNPRNGLETLAITPISKNSAIQRAGRAGRNQPGKCFRLYTAYSYKNELEDETIPEILRTNLITIVLLLKSIGIDDLLNFDYIDVPPKEILIRALEQLYALGALNEEGILTEMGKNMSLFPMDPCLSKIIITSVEYKCLDQILTIVSMLTLGGNIFYKDKDDVKISNKLKEKFIISGTGDHFTLLEVYNQWKDSDYSGLFCKEHYIHSKSLRKARNIKDQLINICKKIGIDYEDESLSINNENTINNIKKCIITGFFYNTVHLCSDGNYRTVKNPHIVNIHPSSCLFKENPKWVVYFELVYTSKEFMREIIEIKPEWLIQIAHFYFKNLEIKNEKKIKNVGTNKINY